MAVEAGFPSTFRPHTFSNGDIMGVYPPPSDLAPMAPATVLGKKRMRSESEVTFNGSVSVKRAREVMEQQPMPSVFTTGVVGDAGLQLLLQQQICVDRIIAIHAEKLRMELLEKHKLQSVQLLAAVGEVFAKKLREKEEEIEKMGKVNWVLQEKVKSLWIENQLWREMAQTSEATANSLRNNLEQALAVVACEDRVGVAGDCVSSSGSVDPSHWNKGDHIHGVEDDEADSCDREAGVVAGRSEGEEDCGQKRRMCRKCGEGESMVLVLPCRHLCVCKVCGSSLSSCPVCNSTVNASVRINLT